MKALELKSVSLKFGESQILKKVSLEIESGETVGVIGPNGSGKTSLFNVISGFQLPHEGSINLFGEDISTLPPFKRALKGIGRVFQNTGIFKEMTVEENMFLAVCKTRGVLLDIFRKVSREETILAHKYVEDVGLKDYLKTKAASLSGGQLRLLEIARSVAAGSKVLLLDEPTAGVSPRMKDDVSNLIVKLKEEGKTILIIEHDMHFIQGFTDRMAVLVQGEIVMEGSPNKIREDKRLQEIYFGGAD